jgi:hypothetical protein
MTVSSPTMPPSGVDTTGDLEQLALARGVRVFNATTLRSNIQAKASSFRGHGGGRPGVVCGRWMVHAQANSTRFGCMSPA